MRHEEHRQGGRLRAWVLGQELADDLVEMAPLDQVAPPQVPDKPLQYARLVVNMTAISFVPVVTSTTIASRGSLKRRAETGKSAAHVLQSF